MRAYAFSSCVDVVRASAATAAMSRVSTSEVFAWPAGSVRLPDLIAAACGVEKFWSNHVGRRIVQDRSSGAAAESPGEATIGEVAQPAARHEPAQGAGHATVRHVSWPLSAHTS